MRKLSQGYIIFRLLRVGAKARKVTSLFHSLFVLFNQEWMSVNIKQNSKSVANFEKSILFILSSEKV